MANNFNDVRCKALWRFENGALIADSKGTNTLTALGAPAADTGDFKEGAACVNLVEASYQYFAIADANLDAGFPLKNGDVVKKLTWCCWVKPTSLPADWKAILSKADYGLASSSLGVEYNDTIYINWGTDGDINTALSLTIAEWYHIVVRVDGVVGTLNVNIFKASDSSIQNYNDTPSAELPVTTKDFRIGQYPDKTTTNNFDGKIDEVVIFNDILTDAEIADIRAGTFGSSFAYVGQIPLTFTPQAETHGSHFYVGQIPLMFTPQAETHGSHFYIGQIPLMFTPQAETHGSHFYVGQIPLTFTPQALSGIDSKYEGLILHRLIPIADYEPVPAGSSTTIPASTGGWAMGGAGVWVSSTPASDTIPEIDVTTGLPTVSLTGFVFGGGTTEVGEAEAVSTFPQADEIVADDEGGFVLCAPQVPEVTGGAATTFPASEVIEAEVGFKLGGTGVWGQVAPADLPSDVLVSTGGFVLSGTGFPLDPGVVPTATVIVPTGGFVLGGRRPDPVEIIYPDVLDRVIISTGGWEFGGDEGVLESIPASTIIESDGAIFLLNGAGLATSKFPPITVIIGDALGGFVLAGPDAAETYEAWVLNGQAFEPSVWSGFNFNSFAVKGGQAYACGDAGIYLLGADHDAGETIQTGARIGPVNFGGDREKRIRGIQYGQGGKNTRVRVLSDEGNVGVFTPERDGRVVVSRDIQGREFTIDIMDFEELSHCEIVPLRLARR